MQRGHCVGRAWGIAQEQVSAHPTGLPPCLPAQQRADLELRAPTPRMAPVVQGLHTVPQEGGGQDQVQKHVP